MVQESIKYYPVPLRKSHKVIAKPDFLVTLLIRQVKVNYTPKNEYFQ